MKFELNPKQRRKSIKVWLSDEERLLVEAKAKNYGYKKLAPYIRDAAIYERVTNVDLKGQQEIYDAYSNNTKEIKKIGKDIRHICTYGTQFPQGERQELLNYMKLIYKKQKDMIELIDKKLDLDVWQEINRSRSFSN